MLERGGADGAEACWAALQIRWKGVDKSDVMVHETMATNGNDDPRKLSAMITRVSDLALAHSTQSVVAGLASDEGDLVFPEYVNFLQAALRVEDGIFRMTRERVVIHLVDVDAKRAEEVLARLTSDFCEEFPALHPPRFKQRLFEVELGGERLRVRDVLTKIFAPRMLH